MMGNKRLYETPELQIHRWTEEDIVTLSNLGEGPGEEVDIKEIGI